MKEESVSARALAGILDVERKSIALWRNGRYYPKYDALIKLVNYFEVTAEYLLGLSDQFERVRKKVEQVECEQVFKARVVEFMEENGYTKYKMAKKLGTGQTVFSRWINKGAIPEVTNLIKLSYLTGETVDYLLGIED